MRSLRDKEVRLGGVQAEMAWGRGDSGEAEVELATGSRSDDVGPRWEQIKKTAFVKANDSTRRGTGPTTALVEEPTMSQLHHRRNIERYVSQLDLARGGGEGRRRRGQPATAAKRFLVAARISGEGGWEENLVVMPC
jgi:hypothetical protein